MSHVNVGDDTGFYWRWHRHIWKWYRILFWDNSVSFKTEKALEMAQDLVGDDTGFIWRWHSLISEMTQINLGDVKGHENVNSRQDPKRYLNKGYYYLHYW